MPKLSPADLRVLLAAGKADALSAMSASKLSDERSCALDYDLGDMTRDMPAPAGRSKAVSTDVANSIEGLMPTLMDIFCGGDEVVRFEPVGPEDVAAAEQKDQLRLQSELHRAHRWIVSRRSRFFGSRAGASCTLRPAHRVGAVGD